MPIQIRVRIRALVMLSRELCDRAAPPNLRPSFQLTEFSSENSSIKPLLSGRDPVFDAVYRARPQAPGGIGLATKGGVCCKFGL